MKKKRTPQVQVNFASSYNVFYLVLSISIDTIALRNICYAMVTIMIKLMLAFPE